jgi:hypothetical protein
VRARHYGSSFSIIGNPDAREGKVRPCDIVGVAGALLVLQDLEPDDAQDMVWLGREWGLAYPGSTSSRGSRTTRERRLRRSGVWVVKTTASEERLERI